MWTAAEIKLLREQLDESQSEFARRFGVNQSTVYRWESYGLPENALWRPMIEDRLNTIRLEVAA